LPDTPAAYPIWKTLRTAHGVHGVQVDDARLVALMTAHGVQHILTLNQADFNRYPGIVVQEPADLLVGSTPPTP
jgi:predicted nucleic acid-binding protein